jgi:hypothetical protein
VKDYPEFHVGEIFSRDWQLKYGLMSVTVYRDTENDRFKEYFGGDRINKTSWHSDVVSFIFQR